MNQKFITETEKLLKGINMSIDDVYDIIKKGVANRFKMMPQLWGYDTVEDLAQNLMVYYLSPMKSTGEIRLNYYIKKYNNKSHIENQIRLSAYQTPLCQARRKEIKNRPISYEVAFNQSNNNDDNAISLKETIADEYVKVKFEENLILEDLINALTETLNQLNLDYLREHSKKDSLSFLTDMNNYILVCNQTKMQLSLLRDLYHGYKRCELNKKYSNYTKQINILKDALSRLYPQYSVERKIA